MTVNTSILYHGPLCNDGFGAALAAWIQFGETAEYVPVMYGNPPPEIPHNHAVYVVDFSYDFETMCELAMNHPYFVLLDHHLGSKEDAQKLEDLQLPNVEVWHEHDECGATLTWSFFHGHRSNPMPELFSYLRDADLWKWELPESREVSAALYSYPKEFVVWNNFCVQSALSKLAHEGTAIRRANLQLIRAMVSQARMAEIGGYTIPAINAPVLFSEAAHEAMKSYPDALFGAYYAIGKDGRWRWGMRGENKVDLNAIAKQYGGGGHFNASGFTVEPGRISFVRDDEGV